ncbi:PucR family transcriptional regulator [Paenibacillus sp. 32O-W]|jgi:Regulator of polyketide synthase expression|uniref:PucR C-terminal helix-turn-helix domain-containing protein n=1 Tax=Paenibacillus cisolokensis TaxID=1658519 RepID=A0ABQ4NBN7_9BACL|nr:MULTISPECIES: helix-turn-helix domain-containing protein [Paenibacillus]ALS25641.1 PucR family transcriptional regulator [Paenibacillus sp. 32O-W]GIQ65600.1 hypothetical protein PACILC2_41680 [Paenibacillus cisolokensis]
MSTPNWMDQLQQILKCPVYHRKLTVSEWREHAARASAGSGKAFGAPQPGQLAERDGKPLFALRTDGQYVDVMEISRSNLTETDKALIGWTIGQLKSGLAGFTGPASDTESIAMQIGQWIIDQLESEHPESTLPDNLTIRGRLFTEMIPFLLVSEHPVAETAGSAYTELEKLLRQFLAEDILLIPLKGQEWLIWGPTSLLTDTESEERAAGEEDSLEESLASICSGLYEMLASEWIGDCHLAVAYPASPATSMVETTRLLRETVYLGRKFHVGNTIHLPWLIHLERLLDSIPESQRIRYVEQVLKRSDVFVEPEILATLETFFELDCNVSETAKKLYIHRNTLLYRLDKLKQETGLDVRQFRDAVLVKIILLLYKVTKRA